MEEEELNRAIRLSLGLPLDDDTQSNTKIDQQNVSSENPKVDLALSSIKEETPQTIHEHFSVDSQTLQQIQQILWAENTTTGDIERWHRQGFHFCSYPTFSLKQGHGGPCGVLASVQAEIIRLFIIPPPDVSVSPEQIPDIPITQVKEYLIEALLHILLRAKLDRSHFVIVTSSTLPLPVGYGPEQLTINAFTDLDGARLFFRENLQQFESDSGVMLFVLSLILTHSIEAIRKDFDDPMSTLTGQFGHCSQELLNLLLLGKATQHIFDGRKYLDGGMIFIGLEDNPEIGYLTQLEALNYVQVGEYFKKPKSPVWVIGSQSHFTVLFSMDRRVNEETEIDQLLTRVQRTFRSYDQQDSGCISVDVLPDILITLGLQYIAHDQNRLSALRAKIEVQGCGIIIWDEFWKIVSQLLTGIPLESALSGDHKQNAQLRRRSDSEIAKLFQEQLDRGVENPVIDFFVHDDNIGAPEIHRHDSFAHESDEGFYFFHLNGFVRPGEENAQLVKFCLHKRTSENTIGTAVPLASTSASDLCYACPIESVLRTKWIGARINWLGQNVPSID